jgi:hypothetical protein
MLTMAVAAVYLAVVRHQPNNIGGGILTFYLITTAWLTARRRDGETSRLDWVALSIPVATGILGWLNGLDALLHLGGSKYGVPGGMHLFMGSVCLVAAGGDIRMLLNKGLLGKRRIRRHLWRMCFGLFIAAGSFFLGPSNRPLRLLSKLGLGQHLPPVFFSTGLYLILTLFPLVLLAYWLVRVRWTNTYRTSGAVCLENPGRRCLESRHEKRWRSRRYELCTDSLGQRYNGTPASSLPDTYIGCLQSLQRFCSGSGSKVFLSVRT